MARIGDIKALRPRQHWVSGRAAAAAFLYFACAVLWFGVFERLAESLAATAREAKLYKGLVGLFFVVGSAFLVAWIVWRELRKQQRIQEALRQSEAQLARLVESAMDAIVSVDAHGKVVVFNPAAQHMFACTSAEAQGRDMRHFLPEFSMDAPSSAAPGASGLHGTLWAVKARRFDASEFPAEASVSGKEADLEPSCTLVIRDVTQRTQLEDQLRQSHTRLEQRVADRTAELQAANRELESFCYSVAHDLRAPLRSIKGFATLLDEEAHDSLNASALECLGRIQASAKQMEELIHALLQLARIARDEIRREAVDLSNIAESVLSELRQSDPIRQVEFICGRELNAFGDPNLLRILLQNLLSNAWKFTTKKPDARIEFGIQNQENGSPEFYVKDNGAGFDISQATSLFQPFQRFHRSDQFEGTGIGLATCQKIVLRHGGSIWADAILNQGATIYFSLPSSAQAEPLRSS